MTDEQKQFPPQPYEQRIDHEFNRSVNPAQNFFPNKNEANTSPEAAMLAAHSPAAAVGRFLRQHNIPQETWSGLIDCSTGLISEYLTGKKALPGEVAERWLETIGTMKDFIQRVAPLPINWHPRLGSVLKKILNDFEKRQLLISVVDLGPKSTISDEIARAASYLADLTTNKS